ncbi:MAG: CBS domain-containing protein [Chlorobi bacterium]|nr:CBS domain-containing protein [Chlorobiota bacterium]
MKNVTAGDLMIPLDQYPHIPYWFTVRQAIAEIFYGELIIDNKRSLPRSVLVFDEEYKLLGIVRRRDIMTGFDPGSMFARTTSQNKQMFNLKVDSDLLEMSNVEILESFKQKSEMSVAEVMLPIDVTLNHDDHLVKIIHELSDYKHALIPVMKDDAVVGVVRTVETLNKIGELLDI